MTEKHKIKVTLKKIKDNYMPTTEFSKVVCKSKFLSEAQLQELRAEYPDIDFCINTKNSGDEVYHAMLELSYDEASKEWKAKVQGKDKIYELSSKKYKHLCKTVIRIQAEEFHKIYMHSGNICS